MDTFLLTSKNGRDEILEKAINEREILEIIKRLCEEAKILETEEKKREFHFGADELEKEIGKIRRKLIAYNKTLASSKNSKISINLLTFEIKTVL